MADLEKALATQLANIEKRTGQSLEELAGIIRSSGLTKHGEIVSMLKASLGMGHGDANTLAHTVKKMTDFPTAADAAADAAEAADTLYVGPKAALRPIHDRVMAAIHEFGPFEEAPKKSYVSLRRSRQFATVGPATKTRVEVGLNMKGLDATDRLQALPAGQMCNYRVRIGSVEEVNDELIGWIRTAYESAG
ncbi:MAG TPA: DUF5655 domain-containing protein [Longimicrobiales bacterium]|nr:DUF5655 domain-containing protein [Longimicrobiales bacterium]